MEMGTISVTKMGRKFHLRSLELSYSTTSSEMATYFQNPHATIWINRSRTLNLIIHMQITIVDLTVIARINSMRGRRIIFVAVNKAIG